jgi:hypothetical protein
MRSGKFFYRGMDDNTTAITDGVAQGWRDAFPIPNASQTPDRLRELVAVLIERDALERAAETDDMNPVNLT